MHLRPMTPAVGRMVAGAGSRSPLDSRNHCGRVVAVALRTLRRVRTGQCPTELRDSRTHACASQSSRQLTGTRLSEQEPPPEAGAEATTRRLRGRAQSSGTASISSALQEAVQPNRAADAGKRSGNPA
jgi:hypothetical protein